MRQQSCEIAVIGGGVIGLSCAWRLAQAGAQVHLFERGQCGQEASWAAGGMIAPQCEAAVHPPLDPQAPAHQAFFKLGLESRSLYPAFYTELLETTGIDAQLQLGKHDPLSSHHQGILYIGSSPNDANLTRFRSQKERGLRAEEGDEVASLWRWLRGENTVRKAIVQFDEKASIWLPQEGQVENRLLTKALFKAARTAGVVIRQSEPVSRIETTSGKNTFETSQGTYSVDKILICSGAWSGRINGLDKGILPPVEPVMGQVIAVRNVSPGTSHVIYSKSCYIIPRLGGRHLIGATMERTGFRKKTTVNGIQQLIDAACKIMPQLRESTLESHWAGLRPALPDGLPALGETSVDGIYVATGHFRNGILLTPITAKLMTDCLLNGKQPPSVLSPARFSQVVTAACASN